MQASRWIVITTEHTKKEPDYLGFSFRVFSVFRGSVLGSGAGKEKGVRNVPDSFFPHSSISREIDNPVVAHHRLITQEGVIEGSRGLSEATPPDIVAG